MKKIVPLLLTLAAIALLAIAALYFTDAQKIGPPSDKVSITVESPETPVIIADVPVTYDEEKPEVIKPSKNVTQKIDASSDKAMVDSLDYISRLLDDAGQQKLQDDYSVIAAALTDSANNAGKAGEDSLARVREAINGKTAAQLSVIADKLSAKK